MAARRRVFLPLTRVTAIDSGQVISTGLVNMRRFEQRAFETLVVGELLDRTVEFVDGSGAATIEDVAIELQRNGDWVDLQAVRPPHGPRALGHPAPPRRDAAGLGRRGHRASARRAAAQGAELLLAQYEDLKPADLADVLHDLGLTRRLEVASALDNERLADVLEELPEDDQVGILQGLARTRAADVLEAMQPDDAADLLGELPDEQAAELLELMEPEEAKDVRRLLAYEDNTAGGLMTTEPVILGPETPIAAALAHVRRQDLTPALASMVFVARPPLETPTGRFIGVVHLQRLLREPPHEVDRLDRRHRHRGHPRRRPAAGGDPPPGHVQPAGAAGRGRREAPARRGLGRRRPRPPAARGLARDGRRGQLLEHAARSAARTPGVTRG